MKILFGTFDWALGHATRDIPLIEGLLGEGHEVHIISTKKALILLKKHFGKRCKYFDVPSIYDMYSQEGSLVLNFVRAIPKILKSFKVAREHSEKIIKEGNYDLVISDCRYDVYDRVDNSYLINHQLRFKTPPGLERLPELWFHKNMKRYKFVLVPDYEKNGLTGRLSHDMRYIKKSKIKYIGILSHLKKKNLKKDVDYFVSISGPENTARDLFKKIIDQRKTLKGKAVIARGNPRENKVEKVDNLEIHSFLNTKQQEEMMNRAKFLIIRGGYTTIMEIVELGIKDVLLIPSPGYGEHESMARFFEKERYFHYVDQGKLNLSKDIPEAKKFKGFNPPWKTETSVKKFLEIVGA